MNPLEETRLLESDEVLRSLSHRAAYRTINVMPFILLPTVVVLTQVVHDSNWQIAGYAVFATYILIGVIYIVLQAWDGVFIGLDELKSNVKVERSRFWRQTILNYLMFAVVFGLFTYFTSNDKPIADIVLNTLVVAGILSALEWKRWRRRLETKKTR